MAFDEPKEVPEGLGKQKMQDGLQIIWIWHDLDLESIAYLFVDAKDCAPITCRSRLKTMQSFNM